MGGTQHLGDYEATSIREAILLAAENPLPDLAGFHLCYEHVCAGSVSAGEMREDADGLAQRLAALHKKFAVER